MHQKKNKVNTVSLKLLIMSFVLEKTFMNYKKNYT